MWNSSSGGTGVEWMTKACGRGNVPVVKRVRSRKREWSETSEPSVNWSSKTSKLEPTGSLELGEVGLKEFVERNELSARPFWVVQERLVAVALDDLLGERQVVLAGGPCRSGKRPAPSGAPCRTCQRAPGAAASMLAFF